jgi:transcriptional regulator with XRE-family HTH domain
MIGRPGAAEALERARAEYDEEVRLYERRRSDVLRQVEVAGRLDITPSAVSEAEHAEDARVSTLRDYLEAIGARLELVAVFDDEQRRVPVQFREEPSA